MRQTTTGQKLRRCRARPSVHELPFDAGGKKKTNNAIVVGLTVVCACNLCLGEPMGFANESRPVPDLAMDHLARCLIGTKSANRTSARSPYHN
jgi:hypothetical protein